MRGDRGGDVGVVDGRRDASLEGRSGRRRVAARLRHESDDPFGDARQVRVADPCREVARRGCRLAGIPEVAAGPQRDHASLDEAACPERVGKTGGRERGVEIARGRDHVASAAMDASERDLDGGDIVGRGKGRRGLERGDRARVLAEACPELADPHVDGSVVGATQADGRLEVVDRLAVRIDRLGAGGGLERRGSGLGGPPRLALVRGDERVSRQVVSVRRPSLGPDRVRRAAVEQAAPSQARRLVGDVAHPAMDEVIGTG